jgi:hypothetical protein
MLVFNHQDHDASIRLILLSCCDWVAERPGAAKDGLGARAAAPEDEVLQDQG